MSSVNVLFYSNHCEGSKHLLSIMQVEKLVNFFYLVCTDNNPKIPPQIKVTPTIIIRGVATPYIAADAFAWVAKVKQWKINITMQKMSTAQQQYMQNINNNLTTGNSNLLGFSDTEMNGMSDIFSFFSKNINQECQEAMPQSYFGCNNLGTENIFTPPLEDGRFKTSAGAKYKISPTKQKELYQNLDSERKKQDELFKLNTENFIKQYSSKK